MSTLSVLHSANWVSALILLLIATAPALLRAVAPMLSVWIAERYRNQRLDRAFRHPEPLQAARILEAFGRLEGEIAGATRAAPETAPAEENTEPEPGSTATRPPDGSDEG
ncbi:hypothetical protein [Symbioplanes lichenis]|uniref:hypothetical protein n=1 Tax=Symbioplanes lichenis TaxID=1629072 RepID=UPI002739DEAB|nr:hypothetical protein [Actinoplanes lichenis]